MQTFNFNFNITAARAAGYSDAEIASYLTQDTGAEVTVEDVTTAAALAVEPCKRSDDADEAVSS